MPMSDYIRRLREQVGHDLLLMPSVTALISNGAGGILLVKHAEAGRWVAPGGCIDPGETPADVLVREVWEETGLLVEPLRVRGVFGGPEFRVRYANGDETLYVMTVFECRILGGEMRPDYVETLDVRFFAREQLPPTSQLSPWVRRVLTDPLQDPRGVHFQAPTWKPPSVRD